MISLVMAGGKGTRMNTNQEKLLLNFKKPIISHVIDSLEQSSCFEKIIAITSFNSPKTEQFLKQIGIPTIHASGKGYAKDLNFALQKLEDDILVVSGDLPLLDSDIIRKIVSLYDENKIWTSILVTEDFVDSLNLSKKFSINYQGKSCFFSGISLVNSKKISSLKQVQEYYTILDDKRIAFNVNTTDDYKMLKNF